MLKEYAPIDYRKWILGSEARRGVNIKRLNVLDKKETEIFDASIPYNDARNDPGQAELVTYFTIKLLGYEPKGQREVAIPAAILHDIGFYFDEPTAWKKFVDSGVDTETEAKRRPHQNRGLLLAGKILHEVNYPNMYLCEIADIIGDHDTRRLPTTDSGNVVRAADCLWRVTLPCLNIYFANAGPKEAFERMKNSALTSPQPFNLDNNALSVGRIELVNTIVHKFGEKCYDLLNDKGYKKELDKVLKFYSKK